MARFLVTYHGGSGMPDTDEGMQQVLAAFGAWAAAGDALVDPGAPLGRTKTISSSTIGDGTAEGAASGYSVLDADDFDAAVALVRSHPFVGRGGTLQLSEAVTP